MSSPSKNTGTVKKKVIGDNGTGKTTLLRCLAGISPYSIDDPGTMTFQIPALNWKFIKEDRLRPSVEAQFAVDWKFTANKKEFLTVKRNFSEGFNEKSSYNKGPIQSVLLYSTVVGSDPLFKELNFLCHGYGAARRMSSAKILTEKKEFAARSQ